MAKQDIRLDAEFVNHPKTKRLIRVLGHEGFYALVSLFSNVAKIYPKGRLKNCDEIDIADMANWDKDPDKLVAALMDEKIGFLELVDGEYCIHDWEDNQPYVYHSDKRSEKAKKAAEARWHADENMGEDNEAHNHDTDSTSNNNFNTGSNAPSNARSTQQACNEHSMSNAPSPTPTPYPIPNPTPKKDIVEQERDSAPEKPVDNSQEVHEEFFKSSYHSTPSPPKKEQIPYKTIIDHLNTKAGTEFKHTTKKTRNCIRARWNEGFRLSDFKTVIDKKCAEWLTDERMVRYIRPPTLFGPKFESYLQQPVKHALSEEEELRRIRQLYGIQEEDAEKEHSYASG